MPTIERDAIAPHIIAIANYLDDDRKDFMDEPDGLRRENHIWQHVAALLAAIGELTPAEDAPMPEMLQAFRNDEVDGLLLRSFPAPPGGKEL